MTGLDLLGVETQPALRSPVALSKAMREVGIALGGGVIGLLAWRPHPILGLLTGAVLAGNAHAVVTKDKTWKQAAKRVACHGVAVAGSLAVPAFPGTAYVATAIAANLLIDSEGIAAEWKHYRDSRDIEDAEVIDVTPVKPDHETKALVRT